MNNDPCDSCCLKATLYCLECIHSGVSEAKDNYRPRTKKNLEIVKQMKKKWRKIENV